MADTAITPSKAARAKARRRRLELDASRNEQDQREEEGTAAVLEALEIKRKADDTLASATRTVGEALRHLLDQNVSVERAAALVQIEAVEVRRLSKAVAGTARAAAIRKHGEATRLDAE